MTDFSLFLQVGPLWYVIPVVLILSLIFSGVGTLILYGIIRVERYLGSKNINIYFWERRQ